MSYPIVAENSIVVLGAPFQEIYCNKPLYDGILTSNHTKLPITVKKNPIRIPYFPLFSRQQQQQKFLVSIPDSHSSKKNALHKYFHSGE